MAAFKWVISKTVIAAVAGLALADGASGETLLPPPSAAKTWTAPIKGGPYVVPRSDVWTMTSKAAAAYRIYVSWPKAPPPPNGYPVLFMLDGDEAFAVTSETANNLGPYWGLAPGIVVAIGYPGESRRFLDFTPPGPAGVDLPPDSGPTGGIDAFLAFVGDELVPTIQAEYPVDPKRRTLMGYSLAGLFVLETLFKRPELFSTYVAGSPSSFYGNREVFTLIPGFADRMRAAHLKRRLLLTIGQYEQSPPPGKEKDPAWLKIAELSRKARMDDNARDLAARLKPLGRVGLELEFRVIPNETHASGEWPVTREALLQAFAEQP
jgi:predicted alpha/beta superfamily hydrolase